MKILFSLVCLFLCSCAVTNNNQPASMTNDYDVWALVKKKGVLRVGVKADTPPFGKRESDGSYWGFDIDMANAIANELGVKVKFVPVSTKERIAYIHQGRVDIVIASMTMTRDREQHVDFSIPYFQDGQSLLFRSNSFLHRYRDLKGKKVGAVTGSTSYKNMSKVQPDCTMINFESYSKGVDALIKGDIDAFTSDQLILMGLKQKHKDRAILEIRGGVFSSEPYGIAFKENQSDLRDQLNGAIMRIWESGVWQETYQVWFGEGSKYEKKSAFHIQVIP